MKKDFDDRWIPFSMINLSIVYMLQFTISLSCR